MILIVAVLLDTRERIAVLVSHVLHEYEMQQNADRGQKAGNYPEL